MDFKNEKNITIFEHPLIQHKISILRDKNTGTNEFRKLVEEIAMLEGFEALGDLPLQDVEIETPIEKCMTPMISGRKLAIVPILRAGLGMVPGVLALVPSAKVGHIGMYRDEETRIPHEYYCKLPNPIDERIIVVTDPMLATGGSAVDAITQIKEHGGKKIKFMCIIAAPEGVQKLHRLSTCGGNSASPVKRGIAQEAVDDLVRLHLFSISQHPCIRVVAILAAHRAALEEYDKTHPRTVHGTK